MAKGAIKYDGLPEDIKRAKVIAESTKPFPQLSCPLCCWSRVIDTRAGRIRFDKLDLVNGDIYQVRYGGGRGSGFYKDPTQSRTLPQIKNDPNLQDLLQQIKNQCTAILKALK